MGLTQVVSGCGLVGPARHDAALALPSEVAPPRVAAERGAPVPLGGTLGRALPTRLAIPGIGLSAPLTRVGREPSGTIAAPPLDEAASAAWYENGPTPGEPGAAVLVGHLDTLTGPAVFARLGELKSGDIVGVVRADETVAVFRVTEARQVPKDQFPAERVHGVAGPRPELRLITCAGRYDPARHAYDDNLIVFATFAAAYRLTDLVRTA